MALIAIPIVDATTKVVRSGDAGGMRAALERLFLAQEPGTLLADFLVTGAGAGAVWEAECVFTEEPIEVTPVVDVASVRVRVIIAGDAPQLEALIAIAVLELAAAQCVWIPKIVEAGSGDGAVWMAVVLGSTAPRPLPCDCPPPSPPDFLQTFHADNGAATIPVAAGPAITDLATTAAFTLAAGQKLLVWARVFYTIATGGTLFTAVTAKPTVGPRIFLDGTGDTVTGPSQRTVTFAGAEGSATSTPPLPPGTYQAILQANTAGGAVAVVDGFPPAVVPGAQLTVAIVAV